MKAYLGCYYCCVRKADKILDEYKVSDFEKKKIIKSVFSKLGAVKDESAPVLMAEIMKYLQQEIEDFNSYQEAKERYNQVLMAKENLIWQEIFQQEDPLYTAIQYALIGNYIDFGAMDCVEEEKLDELLNQHLDFSVSQQEYQELKLELNHAKSMVYITDNAGEIVLDKIAIRVLQELYPHLHIKVIVRGEPILNDATIEDAIQVGLTSYVEVIGNGTNIPGTQIDCILEEARNVIRDADLCIAKGQGNFETLYGEGYPCYYLFLCKCQMFMNKFGMEQFSPVIKKENCTV